MPDTDPDRRSILTPHTAAGVDRRTLLAVLAGAATLGFPTIALAKDDLSREMILNDPAAPTGGNLKGDVTVVSFFDYNCPYCKKSVDPLAEVVKSDGKVRVVYKDWPILSKASITGARLALAAQYQGKYEAAHHALMAIKGRASEEQMRSAVAKSGLDMKRLLKDMDKHEADITRLLRRNGAQAEGLGLQGTPVFLVGPFLIASALDTAGFAQVVKDARAKGSL